MTTTHLVFDIETLRDLSIPFEPKAKLIVPPLGYESLYGPRNRAELFDANPFPPPPCHQIACIGYCKLENYVPKLLRVACADFEKEASEEEQLRAFIGYIESAKPTLVSWNGRGFDIPVIMARAMKYGISAPWWYNDRNTRYRYSQTGHFDVMDVLSDYGAGAKSQMEQVARLCGLPGKPEGMDGSKVDEMVSKGLLGLVKAYCLSDVLQETVVFLRFELLRGEIDLAKYRLCVSALRDLASVNTGLPMMPAGFLSRIDWNTVLLDPASEHKVSVETENGVVVPQ